MKLKLPLVWPVTKGEPPDVEQEMEILARSLKPEKRGVLGITD